MRIAIIGAAGQMGGWLVNHFKLQGHTLIVSDRQYSQSAVTVKSSDLILASSNSAAVKQADAVVVSVPIDQTADVIREVGPHMKRDAVLCEISSVKGDIPGVLKDVATYQVQPLCIHPMFGPGAKSLGGKVILIPILDQGGEKDLVKVLFPSYRVVVTTAEQHDRVMALTISLPYFTSMIIASILADEDLMMLKQLGGTSFAVQLVLTGSIMAQSPSLHSALHRENEYVIGMLRKVQSRTEQGIACLDEGNGDDFEHFYSRIKSSLESNMNLEKKYEEMYRLLENMQWDEGLEVRL
ncbi:MAG: prephenate dehydrogenase/arogenate dehydrogenase family protein [Promethearchaeota archaeon]